MDVLILTCLLIIIILLVKDKVVINKIIKNPNIPKMNNPQDLIGKSKYVECLSMPIDAIKSQKDKTENKEDNFEVRTKGGVLEDTIPEKNSTEITEEDNIDLEEEEEEFKNTGVPLKRRGYARGVSFQELNYAGQLLQNDLLEPALRQKAVALVHKIQGTELFHLMENSMDGTSRKIADLLNKNLPDEPESTDTGNSNDFDIGKFL
ncbi:conjugal transfer protein TraD [Sphingobacterium sp. DR205]|uniref:conjugal transfer protein TraD n=1 Tax=Sphingobacterium sp. DR205 TaxID=2713573 RepID=UPI0013E4D77E|nr:conjugal transfer protein TraD [Sphingobacterium sp. DR205]QIH34501.1 conjugal transfer protein TraD [Sphingobacterium sp. DR205]